MPAKSQSQQRFFGMVLAAKRGKKQTSPAIAKAAKGMSAKSVKDFAQTKRKDLPEKVSESCEVSLFAQMLEEKLNEIK